MLKAKGDPKLRIAESKQLKKEIVACQTLFDDQNKDFKSKLSRIPNIPHESTPKGGPDKNDIGPTKGKLVDFSFKPKDHIELSENLDIIDFKRATKLSGSNFILFKGLGATLERALINFMLDLHVSEHGYKEVLPPVLVSEDSMFATGQLPNLKDDMYKVEKDNLYLIPTAEVPLTNIHRDEVLGDGDLPIYYTAYTSCFRREAGSYGKDTRGLMRVHQFEKVELVKFTKPEDSYKELESLLVNACRILDLLKLPFRIITLASGDISFASAKTYDIELYAPGIDKWLEVSSCSNFEDFQARRANIRYKEKGKNVFVHTLNGSGVALPRLIVAILENYQDSDGSISIPEVLKKYMGNIDKIQKK